MYSGYSPFMSGYCPYSEGVCWSYTNKGLKERNHKSQKGLQDELLGQRSNRSKYYIIFSHSNKKKYNFK